MRKGNKFGVLLVLLVLFYSCANDNNGTAKLLAKLVETTEDSTKVTTVFTYKGNEIVSTDNSILHIDYTYNDGLITKIVATKKSDQSIVTTNYTYNKGKLISLKSSDRNVVNFSHNTDGSVSYEGFSIDATDKQTKKFHGVLSFKKGNLINDSKTLDDSPAGVVSVDSFSYEYDSKKNPFHIILGFDKLLNQHQFVSINNSVISIVENNTTTTADDQTISSAKFHKSIFKYDDGNYPTEQITENAMGNLGYLKTQYFYE